MTKPSITVVGAGIVGLWQTLTLARAGYGVHLVEASAEPFATSASRYAAAMLAPDCEAEGAPQIVRDEGRIGLDLWRKTYPGVHAGGTLVVAAARDRAELARFQRLTGENERIDSARIATLEPDLDARFPAALYFPHEAHVRTPHALAFLLAAARDAGAKVTFGERADPASVPGLVVDCRGLLARADLPGLRGVRGERLLIRSRDVTLSRPVRLLHPRQPLYVVPWGEGLYIVGATLIEREDASPVTVRSALELLGLAYALHPGFGEAEIVDVGAGVRPAFPDNIPRAVVRDGGKRIFVNGVYRHGFLLAPSLAQAVLHFVRDGDTKHPLLAVE